MLYIAHVIVESILPIDVGVGGVWMLGGDSTIKD